MSLEEETGLDSGWINNGGLFISHSGDLTNNLLNKNNSILVLSFVLNDAYYLF